MRGKASRGKHDGGRGGGSRPRAEQISRALSKLLRHQAEKEGLKLGPGGYINLQDVLDNRYIRSLKITLAEIKEIVASNEKQRFKLIPVAEAPGSEDEVAADASAHESDDPSQWLIRANQGHSIKVDEEGLLEPITLDGDLPPVVVHGTTSKAWPVIVSTGGLKPMSRNHVHFASGLPLGFVSLADGQLPDSQTRGEPVISGMRNSSSILIYIDIKRALEGGLKFWRSTNGVILSEGNGKGIVPVEYFARVEDRKAAGIIMKDGKDLSQ